MQLLIHFRAKPRIPQCSSLSNKMESLTVSKAFERSKKTPTANSPRSIADEIFSCKSIKASVVEWFFLKPATQRGYQADFSGHRTCRVGFGRGFLPALDRLIVETNCRLPSLAGTRLLGQGAKMKVKPLQWDSTVEFWPWGNFDLEFLASFGGLSILRVFGLVLRLLVKTRDKGNRLNRNGSGK